MNTNHILTSIFAISIAFNAMAAQFNESAKIDLISEAVVPDNLFLITEGADAPFRSEGGYASFNFNTPSTCTGNKASCGGLLVTYSFKSQTECIKPNLPYQFDELPLTLDDGSTGVFTVPTITDPNNKNRDYLTFGAEGVCYEIAWGFNGSHFDKSSQLANTIIKR